ncbi:MAG TPA: disulfide bond formation protein B [Rubrivivax sp.]|nr:disulfide bond formation protein B [Rubrivivax sp.]
MNAAARSTETAVFLAWLVALVASAGALFLGEVMGKTPCLLCWYQRIAMFPLVLVLGLGVFDGDARSARYALPLAWAGWGLALYHCLLYWGLISEAASPCRQGVSCADADLQVAGFVPIPLMSLLAFTAILALLGWHRKKGDRP